MNNTRRKIKAGLFFLGIVTLIVYALFQSKNLIEGPRITIIEPLNGSTLTYDLVRIRGTAKNIAYIRLNDRQIFINNTGEFEEKLLVSPGYSIIKLTGQDKFGKIDEHFIHLYLPSHIVPPIEDIKRATTTSGERTETSSTSSSTLQQ